MSAGLRERSYVALLAGARAAASWVRYDSLGYASCWRDNLMPDLPLTEIAGDLMKGAGRELDKKLCAAHSSAALAVNAFGPWRAKPETLSLTDVTGFRSVRFEVTCPTGLGGTPPHLDLLAEGETVAAVESKCTEWMERKVARFSRSYDRLYGSHGHSPWFDCIQQLRTQPHRYEFLDVAQLVKHALGLMSRYGARDVQLVYLYWEPSNAADWRECERHRTEAGDLVNSVAGCSVRLLPLSYHELWEEWESRGNPPHLSYLRTRYDCAV